MIRIRKTGKIQRESLDEWLVVKVEPESIVIFETSSISKWYAFTAYDSVRDVYIYWIWYLYILIELIALIERFWFGIAHKLIKSGHYKYTDGERIPWFWFKNISFKDLRKDKKI